MHGIIKDIECITVTYQYNCRMQLTARHNIKAAVLRLKPHENVSGLSSDHIVCRLAMIFPRGDFSNGQMTNDKERISFSMPKVEL
jgi:hypothetical protein